MFRLRAGAEEVSLRIKGRKSYNSTTQSILLRRSGERNV